MFVETVYNTYLFLANLGKTKVECSRCGERFYSYMSEEERIKSEAEGNKTYGCSEGCMMTLMARSERPEEKRSNLNLEICTNCGQKDFLLLTQEEKNNLTYYCRKCRSNLEE